MICNYFACTMQHVILHNWLFIVQPKRICLLICTLQTTGNQIIEVTLSAGNFCITFP